MIKIIELDEDNLTRGAKGLENESKLLNAEFHSPKHHCRQTTTSVEFLSKTAAVSN
jgi:hypothetical protein